ncbi:hypothetical protein QQ045_019512 [Rhodiola kirilowii]
MDTSNPAALVNAELLRLYLGKKVRTVVQVMRTEGGVVHARSADGQQIILKGTPPAPLTTFVEVIGTADSNQSIRADIWTNFGDSFELSNFNQICQLANGEFKHLFL